MGIGILCCDKQNKPDDLFKKIEDTNEPHIFTPNDTPRMGTGDSLNMVKSSPEKLNTSLHNQTIPPNQRVYKIIIYIDKLDLTYKYYDDFGLSFEPAIIIESNPTNEKLFSQIQKDNEEAKNASDNSFNLVQETNLTGDNKSRHKTNDNNDQFDGDGKVYYYKSTYILDVSQEQNWKMKKIKISVINNKNKYNRYNRIIVGMNIIYLWSLVDNQQGIIEGKLPIFNKMTKEMGYIYMKINLVTNDNMMLDMNQSNFINESTTFSEVVLATPYQYIDTINEAKFPVRQIDVLMTLKDNERLLDDKTSKKNQLNLIKTLHASYQNNPKAITDLLTESILKHQHIIIYGILDFLIMKLLERTNDEIIKENKIFMNSLLDSLKNKENVNLFNIIDTIYHYKNYTLLKTYFYFLSCLIEYYRDLEIEEKNFTTKLNFEEIFSMIIDHFGYLFLHLKKLKHMKYEEEEEIREIVHWSLNCLLTLATPNLSDKIIDLALINRLYSVAFNNCIKLVSKPKYLLECLLILSKDSEITALLLKLFRKAIQILLDDKNNYIKSEDRPKIVSKGIKEMILNDEQAEKFLEFISLCIIQYSIYPEIFSNILLILIYFCSDYKYPEIVRKILDTVVISDFCKEFSNYRGVLKKIGKNINYFFYKFISHITEINNSMGEEETWVNLSKWEIEQICNELYDLFKLKKGKDKKWEKSRSLVIFIKNKNLELHEILCCISANLTKNTESSSMLCEEKCYFIPHIVEYFFEINKNSIKKYMEKYKNNKKEKLPLYISIIDNSILSFDNLITRNHDTKEYFMRLLNIRNLTKNKMLFHVSELLDTASSILNSNNQKLKKTAENFIHNFE